MSTSEKSTHEWIVCQGWWEPRVYGRQPITALMIHFQDRRLLGRGTDIIGSFEMNGTVNDNGQELKPRKLAIGRNQTADSGI